MFISDISINRPVLATVMSLVIVLLGIISFESLTVREYPKIDPPVVSVRTVFKGATAQVIESVITTPIEDALSGIEGIKTIQSKSKEEVSQVTVTGKQSKAASPVQQHREIKQTALGPRIKLLPRHHNIKHISHSDTYIQTDAKS